MIYNDTTTKQGIIQIEEMTLFGDNGYGQISSDTYRMYQFTALNNMALDRFVFLAMTADGRWQFDDSNYTDMSIATTNIVSGQQDYEFALEHLEIEKVLIQDNTGQWKIIYTVDEQDSDKLAVTYLENNSGNTGIPTRYDKRGTTIFFDKTPNYSVTNGLKIYFKRGASYFTYTDTTKKPGIPSHFHKFIPAYTIAMYAIDKTMPIATSRWTILEKEEMAIKAFYSRRNRDEKPGLRVNLRDNNR